MVERVYILFILRCFLAFRLARRFPAFTFGCRPPPVETRERRRRKNMKKEKNVLTIDFVEFVFTPPPHSPSPPFHCDFFIALRARPLD